MLLFSLFIISFYTINAAAFDKTYILNGRIVEKPYFGSADDLKEVHPADSSYNLYVDHANGYQIKYPNFMIVDVNFSAVRTVFADNNTRIEVYYDNFSRSDSVASVYSYINYSNNIILNSSDHNIQENRYINVNGHKVHILRWNREKLVKVHNDKNYYVSAKVIKNYNEVYTVLFKSSQPINNYMPIIESLTFIEKQGTAGIHKKLVPIKKAWNEETTDFYARFFGTDQPLTWGIFEPYAPDDLAPLALLEKKLDYEFPIVVRYATFDSPVSKNILDRAYANNKYVELTLQTFNYSMSANENRKMTYKILNGEYDNHFKQYAIMLKDFGHPVLFRLNNEMNGDWCVYSSYYSANDTELYKEVWRHVYNIFAQYEVDNVLWVWNPHDLAFPDFKWNHGFMYYPGDEYVDIVGLTGYNTGNYYPGEKWREFDTIYDPLYRAYTSVFTHPLMITEFGSNSVGGNKVLWIEKMFTHINNYPRIKVAIWWSGTDWDSQLRPARIYRLDENEQVLQAFYRGLHRSAQEN